MREGDLPVQWERVARLAIARYGMTVDRLEPLQAERDAVYRVDTTGSEAGSRFVLRISRRSDASRAVLRSQCHWLHALRRDARLGVPEPVANAHGDLVTTVRIRPRSRVHCTLTHWVDGRPRFLPGGPGVDVLRAVGRLMARIHAHGQTFRPPRGFRCPHWDWDGLFGPSSAWRPVRRSGSGPDRATRQTFTRVMRRTRDAMDRLGAGPDSFGLIHGDLTQANYLCHRNGVRAIDFGDFGRSYYLYDMAVTLLMLKPFDAEGRQRAAFLRGYAEERPLPSECAVLLDLFIAARAVVLARWLTGAASPTDADRKWVSGTLSWLRGIA